MSTYTCMMCNETYEKERTDEEAMEEFRENFGDADDPVLVCDDCYQSFMRRVIELNTMDFMTNPAYSFLDDDVGGWTGTVMYPETPEGWYTVTSIDSSTPDAEAFDEYQPFRKFQIAGKVESDQ